MSQGLDTGSQLELLMRSIVWMPELVYIKDLKLQYVAASASFARVMGYESADALLGKTDLELIEDQEKAQGFMDMDREILRTRQNLLDVREETYDKDSRIVYRSTSRYLISDAAGNPIGILGKVCDITKDVIAERRYEKEVEALFQQEESDCYSALIDLNEWRLQRQKVNRLYEKEFPTTENLDTVVRHSLARAAADTDEACKFYSQFSFAFFSRLYRSGKDYFSFKYYHRLQDGVGLWIKDSIWVRINPQNSHLMILMSLQSIEDLKQRELELHRAAERDGLTGLLNRKCGQSMMEKVLSEENLEDMESYSLFMVDVDEFKKVNDSYGHQTGDRVLVMVAKVLRSCFRENDIICRMGGDEFFAFVRHGRSMVTEDRAQRILDAVRAQAAGSDMPSVTVSVGISTYPEDGKTIDELYRSADMALYAAKKDGRNCFKIFHPLSGKDL